LLLLLVSVTGASRASANGLHPSSGAPEHQRRALVSVPGGLVHAAGGNLLVQRRDLSIDTRLGTVEVGATYNSTSEAWLWSFEVFYDGRLFVDPTGARYDVAGLESGEAIPGSVWVRLDASRLRTKGGLVHEFDATGRLAHIHWASSATPSLEFLAHPVGGTLRTTEIRQCSQLESCAPLFTLAYDAAGQFVAITDRAGRSAHFVWDAQHRLVAARDALDSAESWPGFRYEYVDKKLTAITNSEGERLEYAYQEGRVREVLQVAGQSPRHSFTYGGPTSGTGLYWTRHTDPLGGESVYRYDAQRRLHELENALGERSFWRWLGRRVTREVSPSGLLRIWNYTADDVSTETHSSGNVVRYAYAPHGVDRQHPFRRPVLRVEDDFGVLEERAYDARGRLVSITNGAGERTSFAYDLDEMLAATTDAAGVVSRFSEYGNHGHPASKTRGSYTLRFEYDAVGNLVQGDDRSFDSGPGLGGIVSRSFDEDRNVKAVVLSNLEYGDVAQTDTLTIEHRSDSRRTRVRRPHGGDTEFRYDSLGRLSERRERVDGVWRPTRFERDSHGRLVALERPNGMQEAWSYDALGRLLERSIQREGALQGRLAASYQNSRLVSLLDSAHESAERYFYNVAGLPVLVRFPSGEVLTLRYDGRSRPIRLQYWLPSMQLLRTLEFEYDAAGREAMVREDGALLLERVYEAGRLVRMRYGNGLLRSYGYDPLTGEFTQAVLLTSAGETLETMSVERAACSDFFCIVSQTRTAGALARATTDHHVLGPVAYAAFPHAGRRLTMDHRSPTWFDHGEDGYYGYDSLSNLVSRTRVGGASAHLDFLYNPEHNRLERIESAGGEAVHEYAYDAAGFAISRDGEALSWDAAGRITSIGSRARFVWDALGRPVSTWLNGVETRYLFGGTVQTDGALEPSVLDLGEAAILLREGAHRYRHFDFRGNVKLVSNEDGELVSHYAYGAYGLEAVHGSDEDPIRFAQGRHIGNLVLLGWRLYDPAAARFLAPDPIYQLVNAYSYTLGNPVWFWDPGGTHAFDLGSWGMTVATVGAGLALAPGGQGIGSILFGLGMAITVYGALDAGGALGDAGPPSNSSSGAGSASGSGGEGSGAGGAASGAGGGASAAPGASGGAAAAPSACAPTGAVLRPEARWLLVFLAPVQLILAVLLIRQRRRPERPET
jgi:RHS repeat-associated protein